MPPEQLIAAVRQHNPDIVGLSGLLVKSAQMMVITGEDFARAGITVPLLCGGAALTEKFVMTRIATAYGSPAIYAQDAMSGLDLAKQIVDPARFPQLQERLAKRKAERYDKPAGAEPVKVLATETTRCSHFAVLSEPPSPPDFARHILHDTPIDHIWQWINPRMLYGRHLGIKGASMRLLEQAIDNPKALVELRESDPGAWKVVQMVAEVKEQFRHSPLFTAKAVYRHFRAASEGNALHLYTPEGGPQPVLTLALPRQPGKDGICLADLVNPVGAAPDNFAMFVTTIGTNLRATADELLKQGEYLRGHVLLSLAIESAEGYAELLHRDLRRGWGIVDDPKGSQLEIFKAHYQGRRYSFGYPACPNLEDQRVIWNLLRPEEIGCQLTEEFMMDPEASVSALAFHHPQARYFNAASPAGSSDDA